MIGKILIGLLVITLVLLGVIGAVVPALPGPPIAFLALLIVFFAFPGETTLAFLLLMLLLTLVVTLLDYFAPAITTKWGGGSKAAVWGSTIGVFVGLFFAPWGLILGPLAGAFFGEFIQHQNMQQSLRVAALSFLAFCLTTGLKLIASLWMGWYCLMPFIHAIQHSI